MGRGQGPKCGLQIQSVLMRPKGCVKTEVLSPQIFGTLEPCPRAPHWGIRLDLPGTLRPTPGTIFRRFWEALRVLDGASSVHPIGPSSCAFFLAPWDVLSTRRRVMELRPSWDPLPLLGSASTSSWEAFGQLYGTVLGRCRSPEEAVLEGRGLPLSDLWDLDRHPK